MESINDVEKSVQLVNELPELSRRVLSFVIQFLQQYVIPEKAVTKMDEDNLAMTFAPVFFAQDEMFG